MFLVQYFNNNYFYHLLSLKIYLYHYHFLDAKHLYW